MDWTHNCMLASPKQTVEKRKLHQVIARYQMSLRRSLHVLDMEGHERTLAGAIT
jgi:hypothetical protein